MLIADNVTGVKKIPQDPGGGEGKEKGKGGGKEKREGGNVSKRGRKK